jgi:Fe2+ transport system protein FeoA
LSADEIMTLDKLQNGQSGTVKSLETGTLAGVRLMEMGLFEGSQVTLLRRAPMGDPLEIQVGDYRLSLRKDEAALVRIQL